MNTRKGFSPAELGERAGMKDSCDPHPKDNLLDGFTFEQLIIAVQCNEKVIDKDSVRKVFNEMLETQLDDARCMLKENMRSIIRDAKNR